MNLDAEWTVCKRAVHKVIGNRLGQSRQKSRSAQRVVHKRAVCKSLDSQRTVGKSTMCKRAVRKVIGNRLGQGTQASRRPKDR